MEYFSEAHFRAITNRMSLYEQRTYSDNYQGLPMNEQFDIFLSYNISDSDVVKGIFYALSNMGFKVYLDCIVDANMKSTASRCRSDYHRNGLRVTDVR